VLILLREAVVALTMICERHEKERGVSKNVLSEVCACTSTLPRSRL